MNRSRPSAARIALWKPKSEGEMQRSAAPTARPDDRPYAAAWLVPPHCERETRRARALFQPIGGQMVKLRLAVQLAQPLHAALDAIQMFGEREIGFGCRAQRGGRPDRALCRFSAKRTRRPDQLRMSRFRRRQVLGPRCIHRGRGGSGRRRRSARGIERMPQSQAKREKANSAASRFRGRRDDGSTPSTEAARSCTFDAKDAVVAAAGNGQ